MFAISFIVVLIIKILQLNGRVYTEGFRLQNIKTRHKVKHCKIGEKHLTKLSHIYGESVRNQKQSQEQALNKLPGRKGGMATYHAKLTLAYLRSL